MMNSVSSQIQRAINDAINNQVLPRIQNVIMAGSGQETRRGWETSIERPEIYSKIQQNPKAKTNFSSEHSENHRKGDRTQSNVHDMVTGDNESPNPVSSFSQDVSHQEVISISPMRTSTSRTRELLQLLILIQLLDWPRLDHDAE